MDIIEKWGSMYVHANLYGKCCCIVCGKPAQYIDIFTEQGVCGRECAIKHNEEIDRLMREAESKYSACPE